MNPFVANAPGLPAAWQDALCRVAAAHPRVRALTLFGSRATGTHRPGSDIDLFAEGDDLTLDDLLALRVAIDDLDLPVELDLVLDLPGLSPELRAAIRREGVGVYRR